MLLDVVMQCRRISPSSTSGGEGSKHMPGMSSPTGNLSTMAQHKGTLSIEQFSKEASSPTS
jgi:hypothetical protein